MKSVTDSKLDISTVAKAHTSVTSANTDSNRELLTVAKAHTSVTSASPSVIKAIFVAKQIASQLVASVRSI